MGAPTVLVNRLVKQAATEVLKRSPEPRAEEMCGKLIQIERTENEQSFGGNGAGHLAARDRISGPLMAVEAHLSEDFDSADGVRRNRLRTVLR